METDTSTEVTELRERVAQLQTALETRIVVEQAKGILAERFKLTVDDGFLLLRYAARSSRRNLHDLAAEVITTGATPRSVTVATWTSIGRSRVAHFQAPTPAPPRTSNTRTQAIHRPAPGRSGSRSMRRAFRSVFRSVIGRSQAASLRPHGKRSV